MSSTKWFRSESLRSPKKLGLHVALMIISIAIPFTAAKALNDQNPALYLFRGTVTKRCVYRHFGQARWSFSRSRSIERCCLIVFEQH